MDRTLEKLTGNIHKLKHTHCDSYLHFYETKSTLKTFISASTVLKANFLHTCIRRDFLFTFNLKVNSQNNISTGKTLTCLNVNIKPDKHFFKTLLFIHQSDIKAIVRPLAVLMTLQVSVCTFLENISENVVSHQIVTFKTLWPTCTLYYKNTSKTDSNYDSIL